MDYKDGKILKEYGISVIDTEEKVDLGSLTLSVDALTHIHDQFTSISTYMNDVLNEYKRKLIYTFNKLGIPSIILDSLLIGHHRILISNSIYNKLEDNNELYTTIKGYYESSNLYGVILPSIVIDNDLEGDEYYIE